MDWVHKKTVSKKNFMGEYQKLLTPGGIEAKEQQ